jgi:hypothetical protein
MTDQKQGVAGVGVAADINDMPAEFRRLLEHLHRGGQWGYWWVCTDDKKQNRTIPWPVGEPALLPVADYHYYFSVNPLNRAVEGGGRAKREDIAAINCTFADFDSKDFDGDLTKALAHVDALDPQPSVVHFTGGGYHCFWLLSEPYIITMDEDRVTAENLLRAWVARVGGDREVKDLPRVLRVPGTRNIKPAYAPDFPLATVVRADFDRLYTFDELVALVGPEQMQKTRRGRKPATQKETDLLQVAEALTRLDPRRADDYGSWLQVGMALSELGDFGLQLWDNWSRQSHKHKPGSCAEKWDTFKPGEGLTLASLFLWADEDHPVTAGGVRIPKPPKGRLIQSKDYILALQLLGYSFRINDCNEGLEVNGVPVNDTIEAIIRTQLRDNRYRQVEVARDAYVAEGHHNRYHPAKDYLNGLQWDGGDHISRLGEYFRDEQRAFPTWLRRWLVGAVARVMENGKQNRVLVLDGKQGLGKSHFVRWLASPLPAYYYEGPIDPDNKDHYVRLMSTWIWEVSELGSTTRRADREALKSFLTYETVTVRKAYGHNDTKKPALASFIGTVNNENGFLADPTGSRRFMACTLTDIDRQYSREVDVNQVWAQAVALYRGGETGELTTEESEKANEYNSEYEVEDILDNVLPDLFDIDPTDTTTATTTAQIVAVLRAFAPVITDSERGLTNRLGTTLRRFGLKNKQVWASDPTGKKAQRRGWCGIKPKAEYSQVTATGVESFVVAKI